MPTPPSRGGSDHGGPSPERSLENLTVAGHIAVVDDDPIMTRVVTLLLQRAGFDQVSSFEDPREFVARFAEIRPDLVLLDMNMPHLDGLDVMRRIATLRRPDEYLPILVLTGQSGTQVREQALEAGAVDFLTKPFDRVEVIQRVRNHLRTRRLHETVVEHNTELRAEIDRRAAAERDSQRVHWERTERISAVLAEGGVRARFQPIIDVVSGELFGVEALARLASDPDRFASDRSPEVWFAEAAAVGLDAQLELFVASDAVAHVPELPAGAKMSINFSPSVLTSDPFLTWFCAAPADRLIIELTEHARVRNWEALYERLAVVRSLGGEVAVDDAGSGYAGLREILRLQPDLIKLDRELIERVDDDPIRRALVTALVAFASESSATLIAEGVETAAELERLRSLGVRLCQGYFLGRPGELAAVTAGHSIGRLRDG